MFNLALLYNGNYLTPGSTRRFVLGKEIMGKFQLRIFFYSQF